MNVHERGLVVMWGRTLRRVTAPEILASIVDSGPHATEWVQIENQVYPLYVMIVEQVYPPNAMTVEHHRGYLAIEQPPTEDHVYLAARELFGATDELPRITRIRKAAL